MKRSRRLICQSLILILFIASSSHAGFTCKSDATVFYVLTADGQPVQNAVIYIHVTVEKLGPFLFGALGTHVILPAFGWHEVDILRRLCVTDLKGEATLAPFHFSSFSPFKRSAKFNVFFKGLAYESGQLDPQDVNPLGWVKDNQRLDDGVGGLPDGDQTIYLDEHIANAYVHKQIPPRITINLKISKAEYNRRRQQNHMFPTVLPKPLSGVVGSVDVKTRKMDLQEDFNGSMSLIITENIQILLNGREVEIGQVKRGDRVTLVSKE